MSKGSTQCGSTRCSPSYWDCSIEWCTRRVLKIELQMLSLEDLILSHPCKSFHQSHLIGCCQCRKDTMLILMPLHYLLNCHYKLILFQITLLRMGYCDINLEFGLDKILHYSLT
jgi:hypothetical protein